MDSIHLYGKMKEQIREIYAQQSQKKKKDVVNSWEKETVLEAIQELKGSIPEAEYEKIRDKAFALASIGEEAGFIMGFIYAARLFKECL